MTKRAHNEPDPGSSRNALLILSAGGLVVAGLLVWALTRTVEPASVMETAPVAATPAADNTALTTSAIPPGAISTSAAPAPAPAQPGETSVVTRISAEDLRAKINRNEVTVIDVRDAAAYQQGHIAGAIHIPFTSVQSQLDTIPKGKPIVTYCT